MKIATARAAAAGWVMRHAGDAPWFRGAFFSGSTTSLPDDAELPSGSDVDVMVVTAQDEAPSKIGKFVEQGALIEVTYVPWRLLSSPEQVLASHIYAGSFHRNTIIADPTGDLRRLHASVSQRFGEQVWVRRRCEQARRKIEDGLRAIDATAPFHEQVTTWLFATSVTTLVIIVAALRNPTVRLRYLAAREVLTAHGLSGRYPPLLRLLGCEHLAADRAEHHLRALATTFDAAAAVARTPLPFSTDITASARPIAIDASRRLIDTGDHREAMFWIVATSARCQVILAVDAPPRVRVAHTPAFHALVADLGITTSDDILRRAEEGTRFLPGLWETAETLISAGSRPSL